MKKLFLFIAIALASVGQVWATYTYNAETSVPEWTVNFNSWSAESDAATKTAGTVHNPRLYYNSSKSKWDEHSQANDIAFDAEGFYYMYQPGTARQLPTGDALSALCYVVAKAQGSYFKYNNTSSTVSSPETTITGLTTNSSQTADVTYEFHMPRAGYVRMLIGTDANGDPTGTPNDEWKNVTLSGATTGTASVIYYASGSTYDIKTKTGATTFSTTTYTSAGKKLKSVEFALNSGTTTMTTNPAKLCNNSGTARKLLVYAVEVYMESAASYTITYDANGGSGSMENSTNTISECTFTNEGYDFVEWNTADDGSGDSYAPGDAASSDLDLYAIWTEHQTSSDATLKDLKVNGTTVTGFDAATVEYNVEFPFGTTDVPTVTATATDANAKSVEITQATAANGTATVVVTAEDNTTKTYTIYFTVAETKDLILVFKTGSSPCVGSPSTSSQILSTNAAVSTYISQITFQNVDGTGDDGAETSSKSASLNVGKKEGNAFTLSVKKKGYAFKAMSFLGKIEDATCEYSLDGGDWTTLTSTNTTGDDCYNPFSDAEVTQFRLRSTGNAGVWIRNMQLTIMNSEKTPTAIDNTADETKAVKFVENGQLLIEKNGHIYNTQGQVIR